MFNLHYRLPILYSSNYKALWLYSQYALIILHYRVIRLSKLAFLASIAEYKYLYSYDITLQSSYLKGLTSLDTTSLAPETRVAPWRWEYL